MSKAMLDMKIDELTDQAKVVVSHAAKCLHDLKRRYRRITVWRPVAMEVPTAVAEPIRRALGQRYPVKETSRYWLACWRCPDRKEPVFDLLSYAPAQLYPQRIERDLSERSQVPIKVGPPQVSSEGM